MCCKAASKFNKYLIELGGFEPKDVITSYKSFKVVVKSNGRLVPVASFKESGCVTRAW